MGNLRTSHGKGIKSQEAEECCNDKQYHQPQDTFI